jgi:hypothetical protein
MRQGILCAVLALVLSSGELFAQMHVRQHSHPRVRVITLNRWCPPLLVQAPVPAPYLYPVGYSQNVAAEFVPISPTYVFLGSASPTWLPLVFKDGTTYKVSDYWRVDDQLHFITVEDGGTKSVPHIVPFADLDEQRTKDAAGAQGFRFVIRDKPIQEWLEHRGEQRTPRHRDGARKVNERKQ